MIEKNRIIGMMQGCAIGDAYGMATEMFTQSRIKELVGQVDEPIDSLPDSIISKERKAYSITDDTLNSLMLFEMLEETKGRVDVETYIHKLQEWSHNSPIAGFVTGPSTARALALIEQGVPLEETGKMGTTNGAAMKIAPIATVVDYRELEDLLNTVETICKPTHGTTIAIGGAAVITAVANYALQGNTSWDVMWDIAIRTALASTKYGFTMPCASLAHRLLLAKEIADNAQSQEEFMLKLYNEVGTGLESIETVPSSIAIAYYAKGDPIESAKISAIIGGDTDTVGAISTAICGALNPTSIPHEMIEKIETVNNLSLDLKLNYL